MFKAIARWLSACISEKPNARIEIGEFSTWRSDQRPFLLTPDLVQAANKCSLSPVIKIEQPYTKNTRTTFK